MGQRLSKQKLNMVLIFVRYMLLLTTFGFFAFPQAIFSLAVYSIFLYVMLCGCYYLENQRILSEYILVLLFLILFHGGQIIVFVIAPERYLPVFFNFAEKTVYQGYLYSLVCIQSFDLAYAMFSPGMKQKAVKKTSSDSFLKSARQISTLALCLLAPIVLLQSGMKTFFSLKHGYMNLYAYQGAGFTEHVLMPYLRNLFVIMCILNIVSVSYEKKKIRAPFLLLILYSMLMFLSGTRSGCLSVILPLLLIYTAKVKKIENKTLIKYLLFAVVLMFGSVFMSKYRLILNKDSGGIAEAVRYAYESNPVTETLVEMGGSLTPLLHCINIFDQYEPIRMGASYLASVSLLVPNLFGMLGTVHPAAAFSGLSQWLMDYMHLDHGPGFSIVAESYYNFGMLGWGVFFLWGIFFCKILGEPALQSEERNFISYSTLVLSFSLIRGSASDFIRYFVYEVLLVWILVKLCSRRIS